MYPNIMWKSSCRFVHRVPLLSRARSFSLADSSSAWKLARALSNSASIAWRSRSLLFNSAQIARFGLALLATPAAQNDAAASSQPEHRTGVLCAEDH
jgi:hypothetical protein